MKESKIAGRNAVYIPEHPCASNSGYILKYRYLMEQKLGRYLYSYEHVHHINGNELDDRIENLEILSISEHARLHAKGRPNSLNYEKMFELRAMGLGYKKIAKSLNYSLSSVKSVFQRLEKKKLGL